MEELKFKGTPGPWYVSETGDVVDSSNEDIAQVWPPVEGDEDANARLIAAAPEMLEALLLFVEIDGQDYEMNEGMELVRDWERLKDRVNKAIKKALEE